MARPVLRPRCWSGKNSTLSPLPVAPTDSWPARSPLPSAQSRMARALVDVHTAPPLRPTKAFSAALEFM